MAEPNWSAIRKRYENGEAPDKLAAAFKTPEKTIRGKARSGEWDKRLQPARKAKPRTPARKATTAPRAVSERVPASAASLVIEPLDPEAYLEQHRDDFQGLRAMAMSLLPTVPLMAEQNQGKTLAAIGTALKLVQDGQRKALGVDRATGQEAPEGQTGGIVLVPKKDLPSD